MTRFAFTLSLVAAIAAAAPAADTKKPRPMQIDDLFKFKRVADPQVSPDGKLVAYQVTSVDLDGNKTATAVWVAAPDGTTPPRQVTAGAKRDAHPRWSPDGTKLLFESTRSGSPQLYVLDLAAGGEARQLTTISTGAQTGLWSPDGKRVAFVSGVYPEFSTLPFAESDAKNKERDEANEKSPVKAKVFTKLFFRHWDEYVGDKRQHLFVVDADGGNCRDVTPGDRDANPTSSTFSVGDDFTFTPDSQHLVFTAVPADGEAWSTNHDLCRVSVTNTATAWEPLTKGNPAADNSPRFSGSGKKLAWRAQKRAGYEADKWDVLVADCNPDGTLAGPPANLTAGKDVSAGEIAWSGDYAVNFLADDHAATTLFTASLDGTVDTGISYRVPERRPAPGTVVNSTLKGGTAPRQAQLYGLSSSRDGATWAYIEAAMNYAPRIGGVRFGHDKDTSYIKALGVPDPNAALYAEIGPLPKPESVEVPVEGGVTMQMWVLKPPGFDAGKKWPVAFLVHGGPQGAWENGWSFRWNPSLWAAQGYVVALPNPRGSTGFGQKFVDEISGDWGGKCYRDLMAGLDAVEKLPYVDRDRIGAAGASFGGYMMDWFAVNEAAGRFKCLISHCSVWNFESMWGTTEELWFDEFEHGGLPWEVPGKYAEFSPHKKAGNLAKHRTPMLVVHNDLDFRCPIGQGHELFTALQRLRVPSRMVNFPDEGHWVLKPQNSKRWHEEVFAWLTKYAPPGGR